MLGCLVNPECWEQCDHPEVVYPQFELISNPVKEVLLLGDAS